jgi:hypothetical protein
MRVPQELFGKIEADALTAYRNTSVATTNDLFVEEPP